MYRFLLSLWVAIWSSAVLAQGENRPALPDHAGPFAAYSTIDIHTLTLDVAIDIALRSNPELSASGWELEATQAAVMQAGSLPNPSVEMMVEDTRSATRETTVQFSQPIELGGKRAARVSCA